MTWIYLFSILSAYLLLLFNLFLYWRSINKCLHHHKKTSVLEKHVDSVVRTLRDMIVNGGTSSDIADYMKQLETYRFLKDRSGYFFVMNFNGDILSHGVYGSGGHPKRIPKERIESLISRAKSGGGYEFYPWTDPFTREKYNKQTYVSPVPYTTWFVGAGIVKDYKTRIPLGDSAESSQNFR